MVALVLGIEHVGVQIPAVVRDGNEARAGIGAHQIASQNTGIAERGTAVPRAIRLGNFESLSHGGRVHHAERTLIEAGEFLGRRGIGHGAFERLAELPATIEHGFLAGIDHELRALFHLDGQRSIGVWQAALPHQPSRRAGKVHSHKGRQKIGRFAAGRKLGGDDSSERGHFVAPRRTEGMPDLHVILGPRMGALPRLHRPRHDEVTQLPTQLRKQAVRHPHARLDGAHVEIGRRPFAFLDVERVELAHAAVQEQKNAVLGPTARRHILFGGHVERPQHRQQPEARNRGRASPKEMAAR